MGRNFHYPAILNFFFFFSQKNLFFKKKTVYQRVRKEFLKISESCDFVIKKNKKKTRFFFVFCFFAIEIENLFFSFIHFEVECWKPIQILSSLF